MPVPYRALLAVLVASSLSHAAPAQSRPAAATDPLLDSVASRRIAEKIITQSARVRPGELVLLIGGDRDLRFLEDMAVATRRAGANPIVEYSTSSLARRYYDELPSSLDTVPGDTKFLSIVDVVIGTDYLDGSVLEGIDPKRLAARGRADAPFREALSRWKGRFVQVGNGLYPTPGNAVESGVTETQLAGLFRRGLDADYQALERSADRIRDRLARGGEIRITDPNGTDFTARLSGKNVRTSDGVISDADRQQANSVASVFLPAGEVYAIAELGSARGTLAMSQAYFQHAKITGLKVAVADGRVTSLSARNGLERLLARYEGADKDKSAVGVIDIGINPEVVQPAGSRIHPWSQAGLVTITIGNDQWAGGDNRSDFNYPVQLAEATVTVDGVAIVEKGKLVAH